ncbi:nonribosomal peptide synthase [Aspergillus flavus]|nr:nonribosomal peptide synthase [Aspergillus flavus]RAQ76544.1 nonribosomal peptide synthase [Aspergillus flavus]
MLSPAVCYHTDEGKNGYTFPNLETPKNGVVQTPVQYLIQTAPLHDFCSHQMVDLRTLLQCAWSRVIAQLDSTTDLKADAIYGTKSKSLLEGFISEVKKSQQSTQLENERILTEKLLLPLNPRGTSSLSWLQNDLLCATGGEHGEQSTGGFELAQCGSWIAISASFNPLIVSTRWVNDYIEVFRSFLVALVVGDDELSAPENYLTPEDCARIRNWNSAVPPEINASILDVFSEQVKAHPGSTAVSGWDASLTYQELEDCADQLAYQLQSRGVGPGMLIPLCFEKSAWTVVAIIAVISTGAAFVLLDASQPEARLRSIVMQTRATLMITSSQKKDLGRRLAPEVVSVQPTKSTKNSERSRTLRPVIKPDSLLYVVFTSGSTGQPKGAMISHSNFVSAVHYRRSELYTVTPRVLDFASYSFDISIESTLAPLLLGGCVCVPSDASREADPSDAIKAFNVNQVMLTPSVARLVEPENVPSLRLLHLGGEQISRFDIERWPSTVKLINGYGPAECTVVSTANTVSPSSPEAHTIGRGLGAVTWVVDPADTGRLVPVGAVGELVIEGPLVGSGYLHDEGRTLAAFIVDPPWLRAFGRRGRLYRTGDLVSYNSNGTLTFIGRKDTQVKVNGQRVELGEIEHNLQQEIYNQGNCVVDVVVDLISVNSNSGKQSILLAFLGLERAAQERFAASGTPSVQELTSAMWEILEPINLFKALPRYMVPSIYIPLWCMPLLPSGKINRLKLRSMGESLSVDDLAAFRKPQVATVDTQGRITPQEKLLQSLWGQIFPHRAGSIQPDDNFFSLGGDSLTAMKLVGLIRKHGIENKHSETIRIADILQWPRLADMARCITRVDDKQGDVQDALFDLLPDHIAPSNARQIAAPQCDVQPEQIVDIYPCTPLQEGLMALSAERSGAYIAQNIFELSDRTNIDTLRMAWTHIVMSSVIFRTRIVQLDSQTLAQAVVTVPIEWECYDGKLNDFVAIDRHRPMGIGKALMRLTVVTERSEESLLKCFLVWTAHHAVFDDWILNLITSLVGKMYHGRPPSSFHLTPYKRFIRHLQELNRESFSNYWRQELEGTNAAIFPHLPSAVDKPVADATANFAFSLNDSKLNVHASLPTILRAAWSILVSRHTQTDDVIFGETLTGRNAPVAGVEEMDGPTLTTIPRRVKVQNEMRVAEFLEEIRRHEINSIPYEGFGLQNIQKLSDDARTACQFATLLVIQRDPEVSFDSPMINVTEKVLHEDCGEDGKPYASFFTTYPLMVTISIKDNQINIYASFDSRIIERSQMQVLMHQLEVITRQVIQEPHEVVGGINCLTRKELHQIWSWNRLPWVPVSGSVHDSIAEVSNTRPTAPAVCAWDGSLTYGELDNLSTRLGSYLFKVGVEAESLVPLCFEKSVWTIVSMLAVIKAGGAFVLLDPTQPKQRLGEIIVRAKANYVLTSPLQYDMVSDLASEFNLTIVLVSKSPLDALTDDATVTDRMPQHLDSDRPLFVTFTSGSTGKPKGVISTHGSYLSGVNYRRSILQLPNLDMRVFDFASYSFDVSTDVILSTLLTGGCVCVPSDFDRKNNIPGAINALRVNAADLTPSVSRLLSPESVPGLKVLKLGGEANTAADHALWLGKTTLVNIYGPSECLVVTAKTVLPGTDPCNIGRGLGANTWVADPTNHDRLAPIGSIGELLVEGPILGRGYLDDQKQTDAVFIHNPTWLVKGLPGFQPGREGRVYKTGDLVRYNPDGTLHYIGRKDRQLKVRGQRVEPAEIEGAIKRHMQSKLGMTIDVVADLVTSNRDQRTRLIAFLGLNQVLESRGYSEKDHLGDTVLRDIMWEVTAGLEVLLSQTLPPYMVPSVYVPLRHIPLLPSGKTDRRKLQSAAASLSPEDLSFFRERPKAQNRAIATPKEEKLQKIWADALGVKSIQAEDNFFTIGGDSIAAMRLVGLARDQGLLLSVADIFQRPRLYEMAEKAAETGTELLDIPAFSLLPGANPYVIDEREVAAAQCGCSIELIEDIYPCTPLQEGLMALSTKTPGAYISQNVFQMGNATNTDLMKEAWDYVVRSNPIMRTRVILSARQDLVQVTVQEGIHWASHDSLDCYLKYDRNTSMGLGMPLTRLAWVDDEMTKRSFLVWTAHHAIFDGWVLSLVMENVIRVYHGKSLHVGPPFKGFIKYLKELERAEMDTFWQDEFSGITATPFPALPSSTYQPKADVETKLEMSFTWSTTSNVTSSTFLRLAWAVLVARLTASSDVIFGETLNGRNAPIPGIERMIGPTLTTLPRRIVLEDGLPVADLLHRLKDHEIAMMPFEHVGLQHLQELSADCQAACKFQTLFVVQRGMDHDMSEMSLTISGDVSNFNSYALMLTCAPESDKILFHASHDSNVISPEKMQDVLNQLQNVVMQLSKKMDRPLREINCLSEIDTQQIWKWNHQLPESISIPVHEIIAQQAREHPATEAVCAWDGTFTYRELDTLAGQLAYHLKELGAVSTPGYHIPLCFEKSAWTVISILAVMKAGGSFVLLDVSQPQDRLQHIVSHIKANYILSSPRQSDLASSLAANVVVVSSDFVRSLRQLHTPGPLNPNSALYVVFTSGSTGKPKGVIITHLNFASGVHYRQNVMHMPGFRLLDFPSYSFDASVESNLVPLMIGGCVCIASDELCQNNLSAAISSTNANAVMLTPSSATLISPENAHSLKQLHLGGEKLTAANIETWADKLKLVVGYGPAECAVTTTGRIVKGMVPQKENIGPAFGAVTWLVDPASHDRLVPLGTIGELLIEGPIVGQGYVNDPERTAAAFIENPPWLLAGGGMFAGRQGRLYKTGDLARYDSDGTLIFIGRKDTQVKIRGQRVELQEIEHHVYQYLRDLTGLGPSIVADLISTCSDIANPTLVVFIELEAIMTQKGYLPDPGPAVLYNEMKSMVPGLDQGLRNALPRYMIPSAYVPRWKLPMMPSGKLNRKQLRSDAESLTAEQWNHFRSLISAVSPAARGREVATNDEAAVQRLWADILRIAEKQIKADDSFFTLGGNSITAMKLVELARRRGILFNVADVFAHPVLSDLASRIGRVETTPLNQDDLAYAPLQRLMSSNPTLIQGQSSNIPLVMIHDGGGTTYAYHRMGPVNRPLYGIHFPGYASGTAWKGGIKSLGRHYADLIQKSLLSGPIILGGWSSGGLISLEVALCLKSGPFEVKGVIMVDSVFPAPSLVDETFLAPSSSETNDTAMAADGTLAKMNMFQFNSMLKEYSPPSFEDLFQDLDASKAGLCHEQRSNVNPITEDTHHAERFPVHLLRASSTKASIGELDENMKSFLDATLGWEHYRPRLVSEVDLIDAEHYSLFSANTVAETTRHIRDFCDRITKSRKV